MKFTTAAPETDASRESIHIQPPMLVPQPAIPMSQGIMNTFMQHLDNKNVATSSTSRMLPESREKHALFEEFKQNHNLTHAQTSFLIKLVGKCIEQAADITYDLITQVYENNLEHFGKDKEDPS